jgi:hypothetical protein
MVEKMQRTIASDGGHPENLTLFERSLQRQLMIDESAYDFITEEDVEIYRLPNS